MNLKTIIICNNVFMKIITWGILYENDSSHGIKVQQRKANLHKNEVKIRKQ